MQDEKIARDEIIEEVERVREEIARRYDFDVGRIFDAVKERSLKRQDDKHLEKQATCGSREKYEQALSKVPDVEPEEERDRIE